MTYLVIDCKFLLEFFYNETRKILGEIYNYIQLFNTLNMAFG